MELCNIKSLVLALLVVQNTFHVLLGCYTRTRPGKLYLSSTAVCCDEAVKLITCFLIVSFTYLFKKRQLCNKDKTTNADEEDRPFVDIKTTDTERDIERNGFRAYLRQELQFDYRMAGLAGLYVVQKNLLYVGFSNLDAAVFQVTYQLKVLTTALFSGLLLGRHFSYRQMVALVLLTLGVALVQLDRVDGNASNSYQERSRVEGVLALLGACCTSGFGGVYFELVLKPRAEPEDEATSLPQRLPPSVWAKNVQLGAFGLIIAVGTAFSKDGHAIMSNGFFQGYTPLVVVVVLLQALGGLIVAAIIKYADNILKSFASGLSILSSTMISAWVFGFSVSNFFLSGCLLQFVSIWLYAKKTRA